MAPTPILWLCAFVAAAVFAVMIHSIATFRRAGQGERASASPGVLVEILWAIVPIFIMVSTALPAVRMLAAERAAPDQLADQAHDEPLFTTSAVSYNADRK